MEAEDQSAEREAFENEWIRYAGHLPKRAGDGYVHGPVDLTWRFWRAALSAREAPAREGWQPIETAPKEGDDLVVWTWNGTEVNWMSSTCGFDEGDWDGITHWMWQVRPQPPIAAAPQAPTTEGSET